MENSINRNKVNARRIESWLLNRIAMKGGSNVAKEIGVDKAQITRWKESWLCCWQFWNGVSLMTISQEFQSKLLSTLKRTF